MTSYVLILCLAFSIVFSATIVLHPGDDIQNAVNSNPEGTTYILSPGTYRMQSVQPKNNDIFIGQPSGQAILTGARLLTQFSREGNYYVAENQTQQGQRSGSCLSQYPRCSYPEDFFFDSKPFVHVASLNEVSTGKYFFDYDTHKIYFVDNPTNHVVETSVTRNAFYSKSNDVTITGLVIEKYAIPAQMGAVGDQYPPDGWIVKDCEILLNHGTGVNVNNGGKVQNCYVHDNGQKGVGAGGKGCLIDGNEISSNNYAGFDPGWEAGGSKYSNTVNLTVSYNYVHDNMGPGLWTDVFNIFVTYDGNTCIKNQGPGIFHEISYDAVISNNVAIYNGYTDDTWLWGCGILISSSSNADIHNNIVVVGDQGNGLGLIQQNRGTGTYGPCITRGNHVHNNEIFYLSTHGQSGGVADWHSDWMFNGTNWFESNSYHCLNPEFSGWDWDGAAGDFKYFQSKGQDLQGTVDNNIKTPPKLGNFKAEGITSSEAMITWTTNEKTDGQVDYGTTSQYGSSTPINYFFTTQHAILLTGLRSGTTYHYNVRSRDAVGNLSISGDQQFTTG